MDMKESLGVNAETRLGIVASRACVIVAAPCIFWVLVGAPPGLAGIPLLLLGLTLIALNTHWALCFIAFSITPFCVVQREVAGITFNLPEVLILALAAKEAIRFIARREAFAPRLPLAPLALFVFSLVAAVGTGYIRNNGLMAVLQDFRQFSEFVALFWLVVQCVRTRDEARSIALCFVLGAAIIACHGILQQFTFAGITEKQIASDLVLHQGVRSGSFYGATALGGMMVLACGPALGVLLSSRRRAIQALLVLCIVLCLFAVVFTKTRGSWLGLMVAIIFMGLSVRPSKRMIAGAAAVAALFAALLGPMIAGRLATLADPASDQSLMDRAQYYAAAYQIGRAHPVLGLGWGCYYDISAILENEGYVRVERPDAAALAALEEAGDAEATVHSAYLQLFVKTGALGVVGFFGVVLAWLERIWRARGGGRGEDDGWALYAGVTAGLAGYLFHSTFENFFQWPVMAQSFWLLMGLSFALAPYQERSARYRVPAAALCCAGALFALFMYVCVQLERVHTDNFEQNVQRALADSDLEKALMIAERATIAEPYEPLPKVVYGKVLLLAGQSDAALDQLRQGAGEIWRTGAPPNQDAGMDGYFAPARLALGKYYFDQGDVARAIAQFELARSDVNASLADEVFVEYHPAMYAAYARRGRWERALNFGQPRDDELATLPAWSLVQIGRAQLDRRDWDGLQRIVTALNSRGEFKGEAHYLVGRMRLTQSDFAGAAEALTQAEGNRHAAYFLGAALEGAGRSADAAQAYATVAQGSTLYIAALARAAALAEDPARRTEKMILIASEIGRLNPVRETSSSNAERFKPLAFGCERDDLGRAGRFPVVMLWEDRQAAAGAPTGVTLRLGDDSEFTAALTDSNQILQLRWIENRANWAGVERSYPGDGALPGWIDGGRDWYHLRAEPGFAVVRDDNGDAVLSLPVVSWIFSAPVRIEPGSAWLVIGHLRDPDASAVFGWQIVNQDNIVVGQSIGQTTPVSEGWSARADQVLAGEGAEGLRLVFETVGRVKSPAALDDAAVIELKAPVLEVGEADVKP